MDLMVNLMTIERIEEGIERLTTYLFDNPSKVDTILKFNQGTYGFELTSPEGKQVFIPLSDLFGHIGKLFREHIKDMEDIESSLDELMK